MERSLSHYTSYPGQALYGSGLFMSQKVLGTARRNLGLGKTTLPFPQLLHVVSMIPH